MTISIPSRLSDTELIAELHRFARDERNATAHLVAHLAEFDARRLYLGAGYSSLFTYCREVLHLSEHAAYNRIEAARAARRFPLVLDRLADGLMTLTTVRLLIPHLTDENHRELLMAAARRSKQEVEELLARRRPRPDTPPSVRKVPERLPVLESRGTDETTTVALPAPI
ncbi:MAG TPA: HNH endonuclease, partial [Vicinamibacteria bacterium]|nr:HNH endonuclease [Vicinamibacteria bacterium]